jgi:gamma-glutamylputrescine oxidase
MLTEPPKQAGVAVWREELPPPQAIRMPESRDLDVVVIGGGLSGLSAAYHILAARPGARVVVLEAERIGHGASSRNTGMLTPGVGQNLASLVRRYGAEAAREMYRCSLDAVKFVGQLAAQEGIDVGLRMTGQLVVAHGPAGRRRLAQQAEVMEALDLPCERLTESELSRRLRIIVQSPGDVDGPAALRLPIAGTLHPGRLVAGLSEAIQRRGGCIIEDAKVVSLSTGAPVQVTLANGSTLRAGHVVAAAGGYASALNVQGGRVIPLHLRVLLSEPLTSTQLTELGWPGREGVIDSRRVFNYFRLTEDNRILFGGGQPRYLWGGKIADQPAEGPDLERLVQQLRRFFPVLQDLPIARSWTGVIGYTLDNLPVIGPVRGYERVLYVGGWCGHGIALGTMSGRWVQELIESGSTRQPMPWFRQRAPLIPPEPLRWLGVRTAGWAMAKMDGC